MTVTELKELLESIEREGNGRLKVAVDGYEGGIQDISAESIEIVHVNEDVNGEWYYGQHEETRDKSFPQRLVIHR